MNKRTEKSIQNPNHKISLVIEALSIGILLSIGLCNFGFAQGIGINIETPHESALVEVYATDKGVLIPRLTTAERNIIPSPATGLIIYNTNTNKFNFWDGANWEEINDIFVSTVTGTGTPSEGGVSINISGNDPDVSAMLDVKSDGADKKGLLMPRTTTSAVNYPAEGLLIYNTGTNSFSFYDGTTWQSFCHEGISTTTGTGSFASDGTGVNTDTPDPSAIMDMVSTSRGFLIPRLTENQRGNIISPAIGLMIYNTTDKSIDVYTGDGWHQLMHDAPNAPGTISGNTVVCENATGETYSISAVDGATSYTWTVPSGASVASGQGTTNITVNFGTSSGDICVSADNGCGFSSSSCQAITLNAASASGTAASAQTICTGSSPANITLSGYTGTIQWQYSNDGSTGWTDISGATSATLTSAQMGTLTADRWYRAVVTNSPCASANSNSVKITVNTAPSAPTANAASGIQQNQFTANWSASTGATYYILDVNTASDFSGTWIHNGTNVGNVTGYDVTVPDCGTNYYYRVRACSDYCCSGYSNTITVTTGACGPSCGSQVWMAANMNTGTQVSIATTQSAGQKWCYNDVAANCTTYGGLYQWASAMNLPSSENSVLHYGSDLPDCDPCGSNGTQGICPAGYHIPTDLEWSRYEHCIENTISPTGSTDLSTFQTTIGWRGSSTAGVGPGSKMKVTSSNSPDWNGTNTSGFSALPAGYAYNGASSNMDANAYFWTTTEYNFYGTAYAWYRILSTDHTETYRGYFGNGKTNGYSIRCLKN